MNGIRINWFDGESRSWADGGRFGVEFKIFKTELNESDNSLGVEPSLTIPKKRGIPFILIICCLKSQKQIFQLIWRIYVHKLDWTKAETVLLFGKKKGHGHFIYVIFYEFKQEKWIWQWSRHNQSFLLNCPNNYTKPLGDHLLPELYNNTPQTVFQFFEDHGIATLNWTLGDHWLWIRSIICYLCVMRN